MDNGHIWGLRWQCWDCGFGEKMVMMLTQMILGTSQMVVELAMFWMVLETLACLSL